MPVTANLALPYPVETDTADVPRDIKALADRLDLSGGYGTVLPAAPVEGQRYAYVADAAGGVVWQLRYHVASGKWECLGGPPLYKDTGAAAIACDTVGVYTDFSDGQPAIALPLAGDYILDFGATLSHSAAGQGIQMAPAATGLVVAGFNSVTVSEPTSGGTILASVSRRVRPAAPFSGNLRLQYFVGLAGGSAVRRYLSVTPIRVG